MRPFLITAAGLSEKSLSYLNEDDQTMAIQELIDKFLKPTGEHYIDEATFRYLLIKGDEQLNSGVLSNATNLTNNNQLIEYCNWLIAL